MEDMRLKLGLDMPDVIMLGIDSTHAKGMITHCLARTPEACALLDRLFIALGSSRLFLVFVESELNPSDALTRDDVEWDESLWINLKSRLTKLIPLATERFVKFGKSVEAGPNEAPSRRDR